MTGERFSADVALRWGLINQIVQPQDLLNTACEYALKIAKNAPLAVQATKELALRAREMSLSEGLRMEQFTNRMLSQTEDAKEGRAAFKEKRDAVFKSK